jgi:hypothetical protein
MVIRVHQQSTFSETVTKKLATRRTALKYILGAIENYTIDNIKCWVNSLERNVDNRDLEKIMLVYSGDNKLVEYLEERDFTVVLPAGGRSEIGEFRYVPSTGYNICQSRFKHAARFFLNHRTIEATDTILLTDVGDVVFQADPFTHIRLNASYDNTAIFATVENILYMNEEWGKNNISKFTYLRSTTSGQDNGEISFLKIFHKLVVAGINQHDLFKVSVINVSL